MKLNERILFFFLHCLSHLAGKINPCKRVVWAQKIGGFVYRYIPTRKYLALKNIDRAFPNKSDYWKTKILKKTYSFFMEQFLFFFGFPESYNQTNIKVKNKSLIDEALKQKKGVLYISGHFGFLGMYHRLVWKTKISTDRSCRETEKRGGSPVFY